MTIHTSFSAGRYPFLEGIPRHWSIVPFRRLFSESSEVNGPEPVGSMLSVSGYRGVEEKIYDSEAKRRSPEDLETYRVVRPGQLAVNTMWMNYAGLGVSELTGHMSPAYRSYNISPDLEPRYAHHLMRSSAWVSGYTAHATGVRPNSLQLSRHDLLSFPVLVPPAQEQRAIADYLDHETAEIDAFIAELKRMTVLSQEDWRAQRDSALSIGRGKRGTTTVTKTWFSERASDWQEGPLKHLFDISLGKMLDEGRHVAGAEQYPYVRAGDIGDGTLNSSNLNRMPFSLREQRKFSINAGDILVVEGGSVGTNVVVEDSLDGIYFQKTVNRMRSKADAVPLFYSEVLNAYRESGVLDTVCNRSTIMHLTAEKLGGLVVPVPSVAEQRSLAKHLEATRGKAEKLDQECQRAIELATERRAALISAAVTGQIDMTKRRKPVAEVLKDEVRERV